MYVNRNVHFAKIEFVESHTTPATTFIHWKENIAMSLAVSSTTSLSQTQKVSFYVMCCSLVICSIDCAINY